MIHVYYWGFLCSGVNKATGKVCGAFIGATRYETNVRGGLRDITLARPLRVQCDQCGSQRSYVADEIVYSLQPGEMVPLDREPR